MMRATRMGLHVAAVALAMLAAVSPAHAQSSREDLAIAGLHGTLVLADKPTSPHLVVIVAGSGPTNRDGNQGSGTHPGAQTDNYKLLAEALAAAGLSSFRYDKRGVGASRALITKETVAKAVIGDFADDLATIIGDLQTRPWGKSIVIAGHSEGAMLAMMAAARTRVAGLALLNGAGLPLIDVIERQLSRQPLPTAIAEAVREKVTAYRTNQPITSWPPELASMFNPVIDAFWRSVVAIDPRDLLKPVTVPVLIVGGGKDIQIVREDFDRLDSVKPAGSAILWIEDMAHSMKAALPTDQLPIDAYARERPLSEAFVSGLVAWLKALPPRQP